ncbi:OmpA family protein [Filimonas lacunae]|uniref:OmpA family protein n=1 Tax=Filimonas lacunae TaxID=477680 RepID=A0A173MB28_9BACT|nr:OmpA family protein [Filimonas lacunae]BAV04764.1 outer membrane protein A precursor [Filimonas lacunae]SIT32132.1 OmpA family protein [Filimonas lacunae]
MSLKLKPAGKLFIIVAVVAAGILGVRWYQARPKQVSESLQVGKVVLPDAPEASLSDNAVQLPLPESSPAANGGTQITWLRMAWNSQFSAMYANGGARTMQGSLFDKAHLDVTYTRQDDCNKQMADLVKFAQEYKNNTAATGVLITFMGDGMPAFMTSLAKELEPLGPEYQPIIIPVTHGKSYGEDQVMGPQQWKIDPKNAIGKCVAGVLRDGDINILLKWAGDNGLKVNPDETTYDATAINIIAANDFLDAPNKYIAGYTENRKVMVNGKTTGKDTTVGVDGVATWTPGDVNVAVKKGGLVTIASTRQYASQMPNQTIAIKKWAYDHRTDVENMIIALAQAGDQVRSFNEAKAFAAKVSAEVYNEQDGAYWLKYFNGVEEKDIQGLKVTLGGSAVFNLQDMANTYGLGNDKVDRYKAVYNTFGNLMVKMYPTLMPSFMPYEKAVDKTFLQTVLANHPELLQGKAIETKYASEITSEVSSKSYSIEFETGSANIRSSSYKLLDEIFESAVVAEGLKVGVYGHTDNSGSDAVNLPLSEKRANAVKEYLQNKGLTGNRIEAKGYGSAKPIASNNSESGRSQNRRVEIVLGQ